MTSKQQHLYLIGFMGSGKSAMGRLLAERLKRPLYDLDALIERREGRPIAQIFSDSGEAFFRRLESQLLQELAANATLEPAIIAVGGGAFNQPANRELMHRTGLVLWLDVPLKLAQERALKDPERPLAAAPQQFEALFTQRRAVYALGDVRVEVADDPKPVTCDKILKRLAEAGFYEQGS